MNKLPSGVTFDGDLDDLDDRFHPADYEDGHEWDQFYLDPEERLDVRITGPRPTGPRRRQKRPEVYTPIRRH